MLLACWQSRSRTNKVTLVLTLQHHDGGLLAAALVGLRGRWDLFTNLHIGPNALDQNRLSSPRLRCSRLVPPAERMLFFFFFRQRTEGSALSRDEHEAPRMRSLIDATRPGAVGRAPPPERLSPIHPLGHGGKKEKEKKTTFPRKVQLGKSRGNPQDRKTTRCLILLRAGGWRVLNRSCDHVLRKTRFSTLQTLVTGGGQIVRLWSASLGGSKGRPIDKSNRPAREGE